MKTGVHLWIFVPALVALAAWQIFVSGEPQKLFLFGSPLQILQVAVDDVPKPSLWRDIGVTLSAMLAGLALGTLSGTAGGLLLGVNPLARHLSRPYLVFLGSIQIFTIAPLLIIWFGIGWSAKVAMAALATFFVALQQASGGAAEAEKRYLSYAKSLHADGMRVLRHIVLPGAIQWVVAGVRMNIGFAMLGTLVGEFVSAEAGLGHYIFKASGVYDVPRVWFGIVVFSALALSLTSLVDRAARRFMPGADNRARG